VWQPEEKLLLDHDGDWSSGAYSMNWLTALTDCQSGVWETVLIEYMVERYGEGYIQSGN
jgi:hypothetical protein